MSYISSHTGQEIDGAVVKVSQLLDLFYPVGSIYTSTKNTNPAATLGGTWTQIKDRFLLCAGDSYNAGATGGSATHTHTTAEHTLTVNEIPSHNHNYKSAPHLFAEIDTSGNNVIKPNTSGSCKIMTYTSTDTGGDASHSHGNTGSSSNLPPYKVVYAWERIT